MNTTRRITRVRRRFVPTARRDLREASQAKELGQSAGGIAEAGPFSLFSVTLSKLGALREILLPLFGVTYVVGYAVMSYYAYRAGLGMLPALQAQYFVAGIVPILFALFVLGCVSFAFWSVERIVTHAKPDASTTILASLAIIAYALCSLLISTLKRIAAQSAVVPFLLFVLAIIALTIICVVFSLAAASLVLREPVESLTSRWPFAFQDIKATSRRGGTTLSSIHMVAQLTSVVCAIYVLYGVVRPFVVYLYPYVPQAVGGVQPLAASLSLRRVDMSQQERASLLAPSDRELPIGVSDPSHDPHPVVETLPVYVMFQSDSILLVKVADSRPLGLSWAESPVFEIKKANVLGTRWMSSVVKHGPAH